MKLDVFFSSKSESQLLGSGGEGSGGEGSGGEVVTSPPLNRKVGCSRPTMIRARCLRVRQHYPAQKNNQKNCM